MNNIFYKIVLGVALLGVTSACEPDLTVPLVGEISDEEALSDPAALRKAVTGIYQILGNTKTYGGRFQVASELLGDNIDGSSLSGDLGSIYTRTTSIFGDYKNQMYEDHYRAIFRANVVLENLEVVQDEAQRKTLEGEAKFLRAISHFAVVRLFAQPYVVGAANEHPGIPLRTSSEATAAVRVSVGAVYEQIIEDLKAAASLLPASNAVFATNWAAKGFLAKVYFQINDFENAYAYANDVLQNSPFAFNPSSEEYQKRFSLENSSEVVFAIYSDDQTTDIGDEFRNQFRSDEKNLGNLRLTPNFFSLAANPADARKVWYSDEVQPGFLVTTKFNADNYHVPLLHISELKLIRAEAAAALNVNLSVAIMDVNDIIRRAYGENSQRLLAENATQASVRQRVREEKRLELFGEGDRGMELKRRGALGEEIFVRNAPYNCPGAVLQFPQGEIANSAGFVKNIESGCN